MAKKKNADASDHQKLQEQEQLLNNSNSDPEELAEAKSEEQENNTNKDTADVDAAEHTDTNRVASKENIPNFVMDFLKRHDEMKEVYVDKLGGVFTVDTPKVFLKDAVLYQNPFYKQ